MASAWIERWQYQAKAEPLEPIAPEPDFGWFVQASEPVQTTPLPLEGQLVLGSPPIVASFDWFVTPPDVVRPLERLVPEQYVIGQPPITPSYDWFVQESDIVRPRHQVNEGQFAFVDFSVPVVVAVDFDWFVPPPNVIRPPKQLVPEQSVFSQSPIVAPLDWFHQQSDVIRPLHKVDEGVSVLVDFGVPIILDIDWIVQHPEPILLIHQTQPGWYARGYDNDELAPSFDWFVPSADVVRPLARLVPESFGHTLFPIVVAVGDATTGVQVSTTQVFPTFVVQYQSKAEPLLVEVVVVPDFDWFQQEPEPVLPLHQVQPGISSFVDFSIPVQVVEDFDWFVPPADVIRPPKQLVPEQNVLGQPPIVADFGWFQQEPDVIYPLHQIDEGFYAFVDFSVPVIIDFDWFVLPADIVRLPKSLVPEQFVLGQPSIVARIDWLVQQPGPLPLPKRPESFYVRPEVIEIVVPDFSWSVQHPEPLPLLQRPEGLFVFLLDIVPPVVPNFGWFVPQVEIVRRPLRPLGLLARPLLIIVAPPEDLVFVVRRCIGLDELEILRLLPNSSGFVSIGIVLPDPSGFELPDESLPDPSGYESDDDTTDSLSALVDDNESPSPSGFIGR